MLDLDVYRTGGQAILHGGSLYAIRAADRLPFTYPPVSAVLAVPLALVPFQAAKIGWVAVVYGPLLFAVRAGFRPFLERAGGAVPALFPVILAAAAYLLPVRQDIGFGQVDMLLLGLCLLDCMATSPRWPRGLLIGLATAVKLEPGVFIIYLLLTGRRREAGVAAVSFAGWTALAWLISPRDSVAYWTSAIFDTSRLGGNASAGNQALRGMVLRLHADVAPDLIWLPLALIVGVAGFAAARGCWQHGHELAGITITGLLGALLSPVAWIHHLCWVVVAIGVIAGDGRKARRIWPAVLTSVLFLTTLPDLGRGCPAGRAAAVRSRIRAGELVWPVRARTDPGPVLDCSPGCLRCAKRYLMQHCRTIPRLMVRTKLVSPEQGDPGNGRRKMRNARRRRALYCGNGARSRQRCSSARQLLQRRAPRLLWPPRGRPPRPLPARQDQ